MSLIDKDQTNDFVTCFIIKLMDKLKYNFIVHLNCNLC